MILDDQFRMVCSVSTSKTWTLCGSKATRTLSPVACLGGGSDAGGHLVALVLEVQVDLSAHHLRDIDLSIQLAVGVLCHKLRLVVDVLGTDAHLDLFADVGIQLAVCGLLLGQGMTSPPRSMPY